MEYISSHGREDQIKMAEESAAIGASGRVRILRIYLELTTAPPGLGNPRGGSGNVSGVPHEGGLRQRPMGSRPKEEEELRSLPELLLAEPLQETQDVQFPMPIDPREVQRWLAVGKRVDRLRSLGNAVVPQVVEQIGRLIMQHSQEEWTDEVD